MSFVSALAEMNYIDLFIVLGTPVIVGAYLTSALLLYFRKIRHGENGIYVAMFYDRLIISGSWAVVEFVYTRNLMGLINTPADVFSVRWIRGGLVLLAFYNIYQFYRGLK